MCDTVNGVELKYIQEIKNEATIATIIRWTNNTFYSS